MDLQLDELTEDLIDSLSDYIKQPYNGNDNCNENHRSENDDYFSSCSCSCSCSCSEEEMIESRNRQAAWKFVRSLVLEYADHQKEEQIVIYGHFTLNDGQEVPFYVEQILDYNRVISAELTLGPREKSLVWYQKTPSNVIDHLEEKLPQGLDPSLIAQWMNLIGYRIINDLTAHDYNPYWDD